MVHFKARQHFQVSNGKIDFFAEAGTKKVCSFISKEKMYFSDRGTDYLELHLFPYVSKILSPKMAPNIGQIFKMLNACNKNWPTLGVVGTPRILGLAMH